MQVWAMWAPAIITVIGAVFVAGQVSGRIKDQEVVIKSHNDRLNEHDEKLEDHAVAIAESKAWREGYNAARERKS